LISQMNFWQRLGYLLEKYWPSFLEGAGYTLIIAIVCTAIGCIIGFALGIIQTIPINKRSNPVKRVLLKIVRIIITAYVEVFRGTPMIVQAMFIYYGTAMLMDKPMAMLPAAILIVSINTGAYMTETVRGGILSIDPGQTEGAKAIGMTHFQTMLYIVFPQTLRNILPQIGNNLIINIKDTSVLFVIGVTELFSRGKSVAGALYTYFETFTLVMIFYFIMTFVCSRLLRLWEKKMDGADSYDLATTDTLAHTSGMITHPDVYKTGNSNLDQRDSK
jgi:putative lysine transport system permease protein